MTRVPQLGNLRQLVNKPVRTKSSWVLGTTAKPVLIAGFSTLARPDNHTQNKINFASKV